MKQENLLYGVAYYDEYMPYERLHEDIRMMKEAGINFVRIAESTWSTHEPQNGTFDFSSVDRVLDAMHEADIKVIVGTPTYAVPTWLVKEHPNVLAVTPEGPGKYGARQIMDITHPTYLFYAERIIRKLISRVADHPAVIGFQTDNETKHYDTCGPNVQLLFVKHMREKFNDSLEDLNYTYGLDYWSNRINSWEDFPSVVGTINGSLGAAFAAFQRSLVTDFLNWQISLLNEYKRDDQFVTQNFDFEWRGHSFGLQSRVDHFEASKQFDITGVDIYHPSQDDLTGTEISFGGDIARSTKNDNYFVLETQAQAFTHWTPFPGQLRLQAFSHIASGANMVAYWHWHSIHNSLETYWKGLLSHDFQPNPVYNEAKTIGEDFQRLSPHLVNLKKDNKVAVLVSNEAYTSMEWFKPSFAREKNYNYILRLFYDELYKMNIECDFITPSSNDLEKYSVIIVPALYTAAEDFLESMNDYVNNGGHAVYSFKTGFTDEHLKVRTSQQPGVINEACGITYNMFVEPKNVSLRDDPFQVGVENNYIETWMELITSTSAEVLAYYEHPHWGEYAAVTKNNFGKGTATYIGCIPSPAIVNGILKGALQEAGLKMSNDELSFPIITKVSRNELGKTVRFYFNYSNDEQSIVYQYENGMELLSEEPIKNNEDIFLEAWGMLIIEEE